MTLRPVSLAELPRHPVLHREAGSHFATPVQGQGGPGADIKVRNRLLDVMIYFLIKIPGYMAWCHAWLNLIDPSSFPLFSQLLQIQ